MFQFWWKLMNLPKWGFFLTKKCITCLVGLHPMGIMTGTFYCQITYASLWSIKYHQKDSFFAYFLGNQNYPSTWGVVGLVQILNEFCMKLFMCMYIKPLFMWYDYKAWFFEWKEGKCLDVYCRPEIS